LAGISDPETGLTFPDFNNPANQHNSNLSPADQAAGSQMFQTNLILFEPVQFLDPSLGPVSIVRPTLDQNGGAVAAINGFFAQNLFQHQPSALQTLLLQVAREADAVEFNGEG
jgi:hypothetical protein